LERLTTSLRHLESETKRLPFVRLGSCRDPVAVAYPSTVVFLRFPSGSSCECPSLFFLFDFFVGGGLPPSSNPPFVTDIEVVPAVEVSLVKFSFNVDSTIVRNFKEFNVLAVLADGSWLINVRRRSHDFALLRALVGC